MKFVRSIYGRRLQLRLTCDVSKENRPASSLLYMCLACRFCLGLMFVAALSGCDRSSVEIAAVHGKITIDNKPLFQGKVMFAPMAKGDNVNPGKPAWGKIQADGTFRLTTFKT